MKTAFIGILMVTTFMSASKSYAHFNSSEFNTAIDKISLDQRGIASQLQANPEDSENQNLTKEQQHCLAGSDDEFCDRIAAELALSQKTHK